MGPDSAAENTAEPVLRAECGEENYINTKNKRNHPDRMEVNKYCPRCNKKTVHKEKK